jgi:hypothetical protein
MLTTQATQTNAIHDQFVSLQLSYSTADVEKSVFNTPIFAPVTVSEPVGATKLIVVHGDIFVLEQQSIPKGSKPLTEESGLFQIVGLDAQA